MYGVWCIMVSRAKRNNMCCERSDVPYLPPAGWVDNESEYFASQTRNSLLSKLNLFAYGPGDDGMNVDAWGARKDGNGNSDSWLFVVFVFLASSCTPRPPPWGAPKTKKCRRIFSPRSREFRGLAPESVLVGWLPTISQKCSTGNLLVQKSPKYLFFFLTNFL